MSDHTLVRISTDESDIGYCSRIGGIKIFVDGSDCTNDTLTADERNGTVLLRDMSVEGRRRLVRGEVEIQGLSEEMREAHAESMKYRRVMPDE